MRALFASPIVRLLAAAIVISVLSAAQASPVTGISKHTLANGLRVLIKNVPTADLAAVEVLIGAGVREEESDQSGIAFFTTGMLLRGTQRRSAAEIGVALEIVGGTLRAATSSDYTELGAVTTTTYVDLALDLLADLVTGAKIDPSDVEAQRRINLARVRQQLDAPLNRALDLAAAEVYPYHPYRYPVVGTVDSVMAFTPEQVAKFYQTFYTASNMVVVIASSLRTPVAWAKVQNAFGSVRAKPLPTRLRLLRTVERALAPRPAQPKEVRAVQQTAASWIAISSLGVEVGHRDWAAFRVLTTILGSGLSSRLFVEIRDKQGLAYQVAASFPTRAGPSIFTMFAGTDPANLNKVIEGMHREAAKLAAAPPSSEEMARAKNRIIGLHAIDHEDLRNQAFLLGWYELLGLGYEFDARIPDLVSHVTADDVQRVARTYLKNPVIAAVVPPGR